MSTKNRFSAIVMGVSAGGSRVLKEILPQLPARFPIPVIIVQHISPDSDSYFVHYLDSLCSVVVKEAQEKEKALPGHVYFSPPNYHLLVEEDGTFALSIEDRVNYARPSIDVLFESASFAWCSALIGVILTGANNDGARGLRAIASRGGYTIVQDPESAEVDSMPRAAMATSPVDLVLPLEKIGVTLVALCTQDKKNPDR